jgi:hypothetical protein
MWLMGGQFGGVWPDRLLWQLHADGRYCEQLRQRVLGDQLREDVHNAGERKRDDVV